MRPSAVLAAGALFIGRLVLGTLVPGSAEAQEPPGAPLEEARPPAAPRPDRATPPSGAAAKVPGEPGIDQDPDGDTEDGESLDGERAKPGERGPISPSDLP